MRVSRTPDRRVAAPAVADVVAVLVFAAAGRATHDGDATLTGLLLTAAPFLAGLLISRAVPAVRVAPSGLYAGAVVAVATVVVGLALRALFLGRLPVSFALVATVSLAIVLLGWRAVAAVVGRTVAQRAAR